MQHFNDFVVWLAACPHFVVFTGLCSIASIFTLAYIAYLLQPVIKPDYPPDIGQELVTRLINRIGSPNVQDRLLSIKTDATMSLPGISPEKIDLQNSFEILTSQEIQFYIVKYRRHLYLFVNCCDFRVSNIKCVASDIKTKDLKLLLGIIIRVTRVEHDTFIDNVFARIE